MITYVPPLPEGLTSEFIAKHARMNAQLKRFIINLFDEEFYQDFIIDDDKLTLFYSGYLMGKYGEYWYNYV